MKKPRADFLFSFWEVSESDVSKIIKSLKNKGSSSFDGVSNILIKQLEDVLIRPQTIIINDSLKSGYVPHQMKLAKVLPLYKNGDPKNPSNYRPISLLSVFSKILEKAVYHQVYKFFNKYILCKTQFGFRAESETIHCIMNFMHNINSSPNALHAGIFVDLKKAFDTVNHNILLQKMEILGFDPHCITWFRNYLTGRYQITVFNGKKSRKKRVQIGVPQGSILGPLLFLLYINDLPNATELLLSLFADDTTLQASGKTKEELEHFINTELWKVSEWFDANQLTLHPTKTRYILFNSRGQELDLHLKGIKLKQIAEHSDENCFKFLGLQVDEKLSWKHHCEFLHKKLNKVYYSLNRIKNLFPLKLKVQLFHSLFNSHITYGLQMWGASPHANQIEKIQKRMIRSLLSNGGFVHTEPIQQKFSILKFKDLYAQRIITTFHKIKSLVGPTILQEMFDFKDENSRNSHLVKTVRHTTKIHYQTSLYFMAKKWNELTSNTELRRYILDEGFDTPLKTYVKNIKLLLCKPYQATCNQSPCFICTNNQQNKT